ncbi:MAG: hypothetical protein ABI488_18660 [Polyangiaceae bacterium]
MALAAGAATLALFVWGAFSHLVVIRGLGYAAIPDERRFDAAMPNSLPAGLYAFPAPPDWRGLEPTAEAMTAWEASFRAGPAGMLVIRPRGEGPLSARKLLVQLAADALAVALALFVVSAVPGSFRRRAATVASTGVIGLATVGVIYWNWYAFTDAFFAAQCVDVLGGWLLVGAVLAALAPRPSASDARSPPNATSNVHETP